MVLLLAGNAPAWADGFVLSEWALSNYPSNNNGYVVTNGSPIASSISLYGGNYNYITLPADAHTDYTKIMAADTVVTFHWEYTSFDNWGRSSFDPAFYLIAGNAIVLINDSSAIGSGSVSAWVNSGDVFGFRVATVDGCCGRAELTVSELTERAPDQVPEPSTLALLGTGGAALFGRWRRRMAG
jgi:hypothetical protein